MSECRYKLTTTDILKFKDMQLFDALDLPCFANNHISLFYSGESPEAKELLYAPVCVFSSFIPSYFIIYSIFT